ncbi:L,D-transpeptidase family protein [Phaeovulum sp.]|uniref:L,D-transpeptidase family protein n=1 Tax=Phaeovulum sp. TaxID=2934796 RepID=UPI0039E6463E
MAGILRFKAWAAACAVAIVLVLAPADARAQVSGFNQAIAESAALDPALAQFYAGRDYQPIWTTESDAVRRGAFFAALAGADNHGLPAKRYDAAGLKARFGALQSERQRGLLEVAMSAAFLSYAQDIQTGALDPVRVDPGIVREIPRRDRESILTAFAASDAAEFLRGLPPKAPQYAQLMRAKLDLERAIGQGGWGAPVSAKALRPGDTGGAVIALRNRLFAMGYLSRSAAASFDGNLQKAVQKFQMDNGLTADGVAGEGTLLEVNRTPQERLQSVIVAMERMRWMNGVDLGKRHIWVNLPDFSVRVVDNGKVTFESVTVVGQNIPDRRSPEFSDEMEMMVVNPSWNVPRSITVKEYLPMMQRNANAAGHIKVIDGRGRVVPRSAIDFASYTARNFPFAMKQPPSDGNALGLVKFLFPNKYNIYLHDTPSKSLFNKETRAFSHGCIRVGDPFDLAYVLLSAQTDDPEGEFRRHLNTGRETTIMLEKPVPVHLVYFTAWPTPRGQIEYRRDVYGRDGRIFAALSHAGVAMPALGD